MCSCSTVSANILARDERVWQLIVTCLNCQAVVARDYLKEARPCESHQFLHLLASQLVCRVTRHVWDTGLGDVMAETMLSGLTQSVTHRVWYRLELISCILAGKHSRSSSSTLVRAGLFIFARSITGGFAVAVVVVLLWWVVVLCAVLLLWLCCCGWCCGGLVVAVVGVAWGVVGFVCVLVFTSG